MTNKEAKQKAIEKAYGEYWEQVKEYVDSDGICKWDNNNCSPSRFGIKDFEKMGATAGNQFFWRPKSLQVIENNNGWIRIENEDDLPKDYCSCWVVTNGVIINTPLNYSPVKNQFHDNSIFQDFKWFSHYKIIEKPLPPIY